METYKIAVLGGTGPQGKGLALRFARAGHPVTLGSRDAARAVAVARETADRCGAEAYVAGTTNADACRSADVVLVAVPYDGHAALLEELIDHLTGKVLVSCVNPLAFDALGPYGMDVADGSAAEEAQRIVPGAAVAGAFHHVSAANLWAGGALAHEDILVCGDDAEAKAIAMRLSVAVCGHEGIDAGPLRVARQLEPMTAALIHVNKRYRVRSGIAVTGLAR